MPQNSATFQWGGFQTLDQATPVQGKRIVTVSSLVYRPEEPEVGDKAPIVKCPPSVVTVSLGRLGTSGANLDWSADVSWGVGAQSQRLLCDFQHGTVIRLPAETVSVNAVPYSPRATGSISTVGQSLTLSAQVALGSHHGIDPTLTRRLGPIAPAGNIVVTPPLFARRVSIYPGLPLAPTVDPYASLRVQWLFPGGAELCTVPGPSLAAGRSMPIPGIADLRVDNIDAAQTMNPVVVWHLGV